MSTPALRVLVATDGSECAEMAVDLAANIDWPAGTEIVVAQAVETEVTLAGDLWSRALLDGAADIKSARRAEAQQLVQDVGERLARPGLDVRIVVLEGRAATAIVDQARSMAADLVIVGSRGHGTIEAMLLGSVSAEVVDHSPAPVLVARRRTINNVILAWDGSSCASYAAEVLATWPIFAHSTVHVCSVADLGAPWWTGFPAPGSADLLQYYEDASEVSRQQHKELALEMAAQLRSAGIAADADARSGDAATALLGAAEASGADLIVMGTRGRTGVVRMVLGSVARNVLQHATCSVLIAHDRSAENRQRVLGLE